MTAVVFPPVTIQEKVGDTGTGTWQLQGATTVESLTLNSATLHLQNNCSLTTIGDLSLLGGSLNSDNNTAAMNVGGNFVTHIDLAATLDASTPIVVHVTGTATAHNCTISNRNFTGTPLDATDNCIDGGGNTPDTVIFAQTIASVTTAKTGGTYAAGEVIDIVVNTFEPFDITGTPRLPITTASGLRYINYHSGSGTEALTFRLTALATDTFNAIRTGSAIDLNGGTIKDADGNDQVLALPQLGEDGAIDADVAVSNATSYQTQLFTMPLGIAR